MDVSCQCSASRLENFLVISVERTFKEFGLDSSTLTIQRLQFSSYNNHYFDMTTTPPPDYRTVTLTTLPGLSRQLFLLTVLRRGFYLTGST